MKTKLLAAMIVVFMLHSVAVAQEDYYIRTDSRINLRATYSLEGEKVETVPEGTTLHVVGRFNRWLKIDRNGDVLWMADWVDYTRVDNGGGQEQSQSQEESPSQSFQIIDNCCQVDRQCNAEQEWTAGYLAFHNGHCKLPQFESTVSGVLIEGSEAFVTQVEKALDLLKNRTPEWHTYATSGLDKIEEVTELTGAGVSVGDRRFDITPGHVFSGGLSESALIWLAGAIVHDACHVHLFEAGLTYYGLDGERACLQIHIEALEAIDPNDRYMRYLRDVLANIENLEYQWWWR